MKPVIILNLNNQYTCLVFDGSSWSVEKVQGEVWLDLPAESYLQKLNERLALNELELHFVYEDHQAPNLGTIVQTLTELNTRFQLLRWNLILQKIQASGSDFDDEDESHLTDLFAPVLQVIFHYHTEAEEAKAAEKQKVLSKHVTVLRSEISALRNEKAQMQLQIEATSQPNMELLVSLMPLFFENFFMEVRPEDLAMMAGTVEIPSVSSTYTDPDAETLQLLESKLKNLPQKHKDHVIQFAKNLPHASKLKVRANMRTTLGCA